jgi:hypothetical protein
MATTPLSPAEQQALTQRPLTQLPAAMPIDLSKPFPMVALVAEPTATEHHPLQHRFNV